jgi:hypothetical protein
MITSANQATDCLGYPSLSGVLDPHNPSVG